MITALDLLYGSTQDLPRPSNAFSDDYAWVPIEQRTEGSQASMASGQTRQTSSQWTELKERVFSPPDASTEGPVAETSYYRDQLIRIASMNSGWDGYRAQPIANDAIVRSYRLLTFLSNRASSEHAFIKLPDIVPTGDGSIQLEWEDQIASLFVEIPSYEEHVSYYGHVAGKELTSDEASREDVWDAVNFLCSR